MSIEKEARMSELERLARRVAHTRDYLVAARQERLERMREHGPLNVPVAELRAADEHETAIKDLCAHVTALGLA